MEYESEEDQDALEAFRENEKVAEEKIFQSNREIAGSKLLFRLSDSLNTSPSSRNMPESSIPSTYSPTPFQSPLGRAVRSANIPSDLTPGIVAKRSSDGGTKNEKRRKTKGRNTKVDLSMLASNGGFSDDSASHDGLSNDEIDFPYFQANQQQTIPEIFESQETWPIDDQRGASSSSDWLSRDKNAREDTSIFEQRNSEQFKISAPIDFREIPFEGHGFIQGKSSNGVILYFQTKKTRKFNPIKTSKSCSLLSRPIGTLMDLVKSDIRFDRNIAEQKRYTKPEEPSKNQGETQMWVEKYKPKFYVELVGDEQLNRKVLSWVKQWDYCVFGNRKLNSNNDDPYQRPEKRILLLAGPPGMGKTTLAHVIGKHAGYNVLEVNASEDRTTSAFLNIVQAAVESQSSFISKPNMVVIDEIDGASGAISADSTFINLLVGLSEGEKKKGKWNKKSKKSQPLKRPIICICNDPFSSVLKPLRAVAQIIMFNPPTFNALAKRLNQICSWEGINANLQSVMSLCELSRGDMRSAINTLQFLNHSSEGLSKASLNPLIVGFKDIPSEWSKVCNDIFQIPTATTNKKIENSSFKKPDGTDDYFSRLGELIQGNGDYNRLMNACFENYLSIKLFDVSSKRSNVESRYAQQSEYNIFFDKIQSEIESSQAYSLQPYLVYPLINYHRLFATSANVTISFPKAVFEANNIARHLKNLHLSFSRAMPVKLQPFWGNQNISILDLAPFLMYILSPKFKPINNLLLKPNERKMLERIVTVMIAFGLKLVKEKTPENMVEYILDPPINLLVDLKPFCTSRRTILNFSYTSCQLIAQECDRFRLIPKFENSGPSANTAKFISPADRTVQLSTMMPKEVTVKTSSNHFAMLPKSSQRKEDAENVRIESAVLYKFNEGYSNAVRKPLTMKDIF